MRLEAINLGFGYSERPVGDSANLAIEPGDVLCLLGPNGCGKTTLFKTMLGLLPAQAGEVRIGDVPIGKLTRTDIARRIAYVPQAQGAPFPYTALDLVLMGRVSHGGIFTGPTSEDRDLAMKALEDLGIAELANRDVTRLSGGQRQLVMIARAITQAAPLIVMDEPTASLDFGNQVVVLTEVRRLAARRTGIVLSTHNPDHAFAVAKHVVLMREGSLIARGDPVHVLTAERLQSVYNVPVTIQRLATGQTVCTPRYM